MIAHTDSENEAIKPKGIFVKSINAPKYLVKKVPYFSHFEGFIILFHP
jgi:hypothetical protein